MKSQIINTENNNVTAIYESPTITTYSSDQLLDLIGPVLAGGVSGCDSLMDPECDTGYYAPDHDTRARFV